MGSALYIVLERNIEGLDPFVGGKGLADATDELDALATRLGVRPFMEFFSVPPDEVADLLDEEMGGPDMDGLDLREAWFEAAEGLKTVDRLLAHLAENPGAISESGGVVAELREFQTVLTRASNAHVKWHLAVDY
jgi:hypothetical protein